MSNFRYTERRSPTLQTLSQQQQQQQQEATIGRKGSNDISGIPPRLKVLLHKGVTWDDYQHELKSRKLDPVVKKRLTCPRKFSSDQDSPSRRSISSYGQLDNETFRAQSVSPQDLDYNQDFRRSNTAESYLPQHGRQVRAKPKYISGEYVQSQHLRAQSAAGFEDWGVQQERKDEYSVPTIAWRGPPSVPAQMTFGGHRYVRCSDSGADFAESNSGNSRKSEGSHKQAVLRAGDVLKAPPSPSGSDTDNGVKTGCLPSHFFVTSQSGKHHRSQSEDYGPREKTESPVRPQKSLPTDYSVQNSIRTKKSSQRRSKLGIYSSNDSMSSSGTQTMKSWVEVEEEVPLASVSPERRGYSSSSSSKSNTPIYCSKSQEWYYPAMAAIHSRATDANTEQEHLRNVLEDPTAMVKRAVSLDAGFSCVANQVSGHGCQEKSDADDFRGSGGLAPLVRSNSNPEVLSERVPLSRRTHSFQCVGEKDSVPKEDDEFSQQLSRIIQEYEDKLQIATRADAPGQDPPENPPEDLPGDACPAPSIGMGEEKSREDVWDVNEGNRKSFPVSVHGIGAHRKADLPWEVTVSIPARSVSQEVPSGRLLSQSSATEMVIRQAISDGHSFDVQRSRTGISDLDDSDFATDMLPPPDMPQIVQCRWCYSLLAVPVGSTPNKSGYIRLRCKKCVQVSRYKEYDPGDVADPQPDLPTCRTEKFVYRTGGKPLTMRRIQSCGNGEWNLELVGFQADMAGAPGKRDKVKPAKKVSTKSLSEVVFQAGGVAQETDSDVWVNGARLSEEDVRLAEVRAGPIERGKYWYDSQAGFWGVAGGPCLGIIPSGIPQFSAPLSGQCANGSTRVWVNGRHLHSNDFRVLQMRGLRDVVNVAYIIDQDGRVFLECTGEFVQNLGKLQPSLEKVGRGLGMYQPP